MTKLPPLKARIVTNVTLSPSFLVILTLNVVKRKNLTQGRLREESIRDSSPVRLRMTDRAAKQSQGEGKFLNIFRQPVK